ncbi:MAG TPA: glycosyltransferase, partial [Longimicrobium sp.]|nr:glycosyltransferase [Longimicrobium sp.]
MKAMRIVYLWDADYPWDVRAEKVCAALSAAGHHVHLAARNRARLAPRERRPEATVHRMPPLAGVGARMDALLSFPAFFNPRWLRHLARVADHARAEAIVVRDLPLAPTALRVGGARGVPVVLDMAENYPAMLRETWDAGRARPLDLLARNPRLAAMVERAVLPRMDRVLVVVEESAERVKVLGVDPARVTVVGNTPPRARARDPRPRKAEPGAPLELVYLGLMEIHRGVGDLLDAVALLRRRSFPVRLRMVGDGRDLPLFRARAEGLGLGADAVEWLGRVPHADALRMVAGADVGVVPHRADDSWNSTIPNKLFDYMAAGLPVASSDAAPAARVVRETGAGVVFSSGAPPALADAVAALADPALRARMGEAGRRAVLREYNWERDTARLLAAVESVAAAGPASAP